MLFLRYLAINLLRFVFEDKFYRLVNILGQKTSLYIASDQVLDADKHSVVSFVQGLRPSRLQRQLERDLRLSARNLTRRGDVQSVLNQLDGL